MRQVNFRINDVEYERLKWLAKRRSASIASISKNILKKALKDELMDELAQAYMKGEVGLKEAWKLSGLPFIDFLDELCKRGVEPPISADIDEKTHDVARKLKELLE